MATERSGRRTERPARIEDFAGSSDAVGLESRGWIGHVELVVDAEAISRTRADTARQCFEPAISSGCEFLSQWRATVLAIEDQFNAPGLRRPATKGGPLGAELRAEIQRQIVTHNSSPWAYLPSYSGGAQSAAPDIERSKFACQA